MEKVKTESEDQPESSGDKQLEVQKSVEEDVAAAKEQSQVAKEQSQVKQILEERIDLYKVDIEENELNLRRNIILGGVYYFDMLQIPPQPKRVGNWVICQLETPQSLKSIPWT